MDRPIGAVGSGFTEENQIRDVQIEGARESSDLVVPLPLGVAAKAVDQYQGRLRAAGPKRGPDVDGGETESGPSGQEVDCARDEMMVDEEEAEQEVVEVDKAEAPEEAAEEVAGEGDARADHLSLFFLPY